MNYLLVDCIINLLMMAFQSVKAFHVVLRENRDVIQSAGVVLRDAEAENRWGFLSPPMQQFQHVMLLCVATVSEAWGSWAFLSCPQPRCSLCSWSWDWLCRKAPFGTLLPDAEQSIYPLVSVALYSFDKIVAQLFVRQELHWQPCMYWFQSAAPSYEICFHSASS